MTALLSSADLLSWGWRIPFLIAGPMGVIGLYLRMRLKETPAFAAEVEKAEAAAPGIGAGGGGPGSADDLPLGASLLRR